MSGRVAIRNIVGTQGVEVTRDLVEADETLGPVKRSGARSCAKFRQAGPSDLRHIRPELGLIIEDDCDCL